MKLSTLISSLVLSVPLIAGAQTPISSLPTATVANSSDVTVLVQAGVTKQLSVANLLSATTNANSILTTNIVQALLKQGANISIVTNASGQLTITVTGALIAGNNLSDLTVPITASKNIGTYPNSVRPTMFPNLVGWWDFSSISSTTGTKITSVPDLSGNGFTLTNGVSAFSPTYVAKGINGLPSLLFNPTLSNNLATISSFFSSAFNTNLTVYIVRQMTNIPVDLSIECISGNGDWYIGMVPADQGTAAADYEGWRIHSGSFFGSRPISLFDPFGVTFISRPDRILNRFNGTRVEFLLTAPTMTPTGSFFVGCRTGFETLGWNGLISEIIVFNASHDDTTASLLENNYLAPKYNLPTIKAIGIFDGASLTAGVGATTNGSYPQQAASLIGGSSQWNLINMGVASQNASTNINEATNSFIPALIGKSKSFYVFWSGDNDIIHGATPQQAYTNVVTVCQLARQTGTKVIAISILPDYGFATNGVPTFEASRLTFNSLMRSNWNTFADGFYDAGNDQYLAYSQYAPTNGVFYWTDATHLNATGYSVIATNVANVINSIFKSTGITPTINNVGVSIGTNVNGLVNIVGNVVNGSNTTFTSYSIGDTLVVGLTSLIFKSITSDTNATITDNNSIAGYNPFTIYKAPFVSGGFTTNGNQKVAVTAGGSLVLTGTDLQGSTSVTWANGDSRWSWSAGPSYFTIFNKQTGNFPLLLTTNATDGISITSTNIIVSHTNIAMGSATAPYITSGTGTPQGNLIAPVGSIYMRIDGGSSTSFYVKESGAGLNTGWVAK